MIALRPATLADRAAVYAGLCLSDTTAMHMGPPDYPEQPVPSWEAFLADFEDFYFLPEGRARGGVDLIVSGEEVLGCVCYASFHLHPGMAELDIWLNRQTLCGRGYGRQALGVLIERLRAELVIGEFIIRPSVRNAQAIAAYEKAGFQRVAESDKGATIARFVLPEYRAALGDGDYGLAETAVLVRVLR